MFFYSKIEELLGGNMTKKKAKKCPEIKLTRAEEISKQYGELSKCCSVIADIGASRPDHVTIHRGGWRLSGYEITAAGIDIEEVYAHIRRLANKRRLELECELVKLET